MLLHCVIIHFPSPDGLPGRPFWMGRWGGKRNQPTTFTHPLFLGSVDLRKPLEKILPSSWLPPNSFPKISVP
eukprot:2098383-Pyramimonas_sp.AAC.1